MLMALFLRVGVSSFRYITFSQVYMGQIFYESFLLKSILFKLFDLISSPITARFSFLDCETLGSLLFAEIDMNINSVKAVRVMVYSEFVNYVKEHLEEFEKLRVSLPTASVKKRTTLPPNKRPSNDLLLEKPKRPKSQGEGKNGTLDEFVIKFPSPVSKCASTENAENGVDVRPESKDITSRIEMEINNESLKKGISFDSPQNNSDDKDEKPIVIDLTSDVESTH